MRPRPGAPRPAPPLPPTTRGDRHCPDCGEETAHTSQRKLARFGRWLIGGTVVLATGVLVYFFLAVGLDRPGVLATDVVLTGVVGAILVFLASRRQEYHVVCEQCSRSTRRLSPPTWTRRHVREPRAHMPSESAGS